VARESYVAPAVVESFVTGSLRRHWATSRSSTLRSRPESTLLKALSGER